MNSLCKTTGKYFLHDLSCCDPGTDPLEIFQYEKTRELAVEVTVLHSSLRYSSSSLQPLTDLQNLSEASRLELDKEFSTCLLVMTRAEHMASYKCIKCWWPILLTWGRVVNVVLVVSNNTDPYTRIVTAAYFVASANKIVSSLSKRFLLQSL
jgi:hypothetical protein